MKVSNTRAVTGLATASYTTRRNGRAFTAVAVCGNVGGKVEALFSLVGSAKVPAQRELRGLLEGRSVVAAAPWACFDAVDFGTRSAETAFDTAAEYDGLLYAVAAHRENVIDTLRENDRSHLQPQALAAFDARCAAKSSLYVDIGVTVRRDSSAGNNGTLVDVEEVSDQGATIGHVFAAVNPRRGRIEFKAQGNGGVQCGFSSDFKGAVLMLVAHVRMIGAAVPYFGVYHVDEDGEHELCEVDGGVCYVAHRTEEVAQKEAGCAATGNKSKYVAKPIPAGVRVFDALLNCEALSGAHPVAEVEGPKEEAYELRSKSPRENAQHAIDCALEQVSGADVGALLTLDYIGPDRGYLFIMQGPKDAQGVRPVTTLAAGCTSVERLMVHWAGFVDNLRPVVKTDNEVLAKSLQIQRARQLGYTVHAPGAGETIWAFCIDGDYTDGFADGPSAWDGAIADMNAPRATKAAPGEMIYPATGPCAVGGAA